MRFWTKKAEWLSQRHTLQTPTHYLSYLEITALYFHGRYVK